MRSQSIETNRAHASTGPTAHQLAGRACRRRDRVHEALVDADEQGDGAARDAGHGVRHAHQEPASEVEGPLAAHGGSVAGHRARRSQSGTPSQTSSATSITKSIE